MILRTGLAALLLGLAGSASGQMTVNVTAESDFIFRGASLSDGKPDASLNLDYDNAGGWYAGGSATAVDFDSGQAQAALFVYGGLAQRVPSGLAWEMGVTVAAFANDAHYDYAEAFGGLIGQGWNARVYLSPSYFGSGVHTVYAEFNGSMPLSGVWQLFAHVGALAPIGGDQASDSRRAGFDARLGLRTAIGPAELRLAWVGASRGSIYPPSYALQRSALVLSAACFF